MTWFGFLAGVFIPPDYEHMKDVVGKLPPVNKAVLLFVKKEHS